MCETSICLIHLFGCSSEHDVDESSPAQIADTIFVNGKFLAVNGAIASRAENTSGSLEVGKDADFIVLGRNIFEVPITDVGETQVELSVVAGKVVFERD